MLDLITIFSAAGLQQELKNANGDKSISDFFRPFVDLQASEKIPVVALVFVLDVFYSFELTVHESSHLTVTEF